MNLRYAFQTPSKLYLVLDYIGGGELFNRLNASKDHALSVKEARFYAAEMVLALEHLHANNIVYRDLKPSVAGRDKRRAVHASADERGRALASCVCLCCAGLHELIHLDLGAARACACLPISTVKIFSCKKTATSV